MLKIDRFHFTDFNLNCIVMHAFLFAYDPTTREERTSSSVTLLFTRSSRYTSPCIELSRSKNRAGYLFHERMLDIDFHERLPQITGVSFDRAYVSREDVNIRVINCTRWVCGTISSKSTWVLMQMFDHHR